MVTEVQTFFAVLEIKELLKKDEMFLNKCTSVKNLKLFKEYSYCSKYGAL